jgi:uncharacterized delta-60 repeat protein
MKIPNHFQIIILTFFSLINALCFGQQMILDPTFNIGSGFNDAVRANAIQPDGKIIVGGDFTSFDGVGINRIVRLNSNGTLDLSFNSSAGFDAVVRTIAIQIDGKILVGGDFTSYNGVNRNGIVRLNNDGTIDNSFDAGLSVVEQVRTIAIQSDNLIIIGGGPTLSPNSGFVKRINLDGTNDLSFNSGAGFNGRVNSISIQQDGKVIAVGNYTSFLGVNYNGIIRLNSNASIDLSFNTGSGFAPLGNTPTYAWSSFLQADGKILIGGYFGTYNGSDVYCLARLNSDGTLDPLTLPPTADDVRRAIQLNNGKILKGGITGNYFAKLNADGSLNSTYQFNGAVYTISEQVNGRALVGGSFATFNDVSTNRFVRLINVANTFSDSICLGGSYVWNGQTYTQPGQYTQLLNAQNGADSVVILNLSTFANASFMQSPNICIVGMDSLTNLNHIVWEKPITTGIDSFYVYKETNVSNIYTKIGATNYNDLAVFLDQNSNPAIQAYRYKLAMLNTCGIESNLGDFHKTIHLTINAGVGGAWNLIWSHYEGLTFGSYNIYRGTSQSNMSLLTTIQSNLNSYTDLTPPVGPVYYQIEIVNPNNCDPTKAINYAVSKSNIVNNDMVGINSLNIADFNLYPNPTSNSVTVSFNNNLVGSGYEIIDNSGRTVVKGTLLDENQTVDLNNLSTGIYSFRVTGELSKTLKLVKN